MPVFISRGIVPDAPVVSSSDPQNTALAIAANSLSAGQWVELTQTNMASVILSGSHSGNRFPYAMSAAWDVDRRIMHFIGTDHSEAPKYMTWDGDTNLWTDFGTTPVSSLNGHGYDHIALYPNTGDVYWREYGSGAVYSMPQGGSSFSFLTQWASGGFIQVAMGTCWWTGTMTGKGADGVFIIFDEGDNMALHIYDPLANTWEDIAPILPGSTSTYHGMMEYSSVYNVAIFGGGNAYPNRVWRLNSDKSVTALTDAPGNGVGPTHGDVCIDPVSGKFLLISNTDMWELDPTGSGTWTQLSDPPAAVNSNTNSNGTGGTVSFPISNYGVTAWMSAVGSSSCNCYLYKHTES